MRRKTLQNSFFNGVSTGCASKSVKQASKVHHKGHQKGIKKASRVHQKGVKRASFRHQKGVKRASKRHQKCIKRASKGHQRCISSGYFYFDAYASRTICTTSGHHGAALTHHLASGFSKFFCKNFSSASETRP